MADISQVKLPNGDTYNLVDETSGYIKNYTETDPIFSASAASGITATDISNWNGKSSTDEKVKYTPLTGTDTNAYGILFAQNNGSTEQTTTVYSGRVRFTPSEGKISYFNGSGSRVGYLSYKELKLASDASTYSGSLNVTNLTSSRTYTLPDKTGTIALTSDIPDTSSFLTSETDPVFSVSAAAGITATDISNWNAKVSDDKTWNGVTLNKSIYGQNSDKYIPFISGSSSSGTTAYYTKSTATPTAGYIAQYDSNSYLYSTTPSANDNSTKVATTAYVDTAIPKVYSSTNTGGYLTMATLPIYDGTVV